MKTIFGVPKPLTQKPFRGLVRPWRKGGVLRLKRKGEKKKKCST